MKNIKNYFVIILAVISFAIIISAASARSEALVNERGYQKEIYEYQQQAKRYEAEIYDLKVDLRITSDALEKASYHIEMLNKERGGE